MICTDDGIEFKLLVRNPQRKDDILIVVFSIENIGRNGDTVRSSLAVASANSFHFNCETTEVNHD